jgi:hypothetical protein
MVQDIGWGVSIIHRIRGIFCLIPSKEFELHEILQKTVKESGIGGRSGEISQVFFRFKAGFPCKRRGKFVYYMPYRDLAAGGGREKETCHTTKGGYRYGKFVTVGTAEGIKVPQV